MKFATRCTKGTKAVWHTDDGLTREDCIKLVNNYYALNNQLNRVTVILMQVV